MVTKRLDELGDRMKRYERQETAQTFCPNTWLYVRIDGRGFSKFTKGLKRPYDERLSNLMVKTTEYLVSETNARVGYTQSDETSLLIYNRYGNDSAIFDVKKQKLVSIIAGLTSSYFNRHLPNYIPEKMDYGRLPVFDCRIFSVPNDVEAMNAIYWRELECVKNSISMAAHDNFSHKELHKKNSKDMKDMLLNCKGISWDEYPEFFKYGTYVKRVKYFKDTDNGPVERNRIYSSTTTLSSFREDTVKKVEFVTSKFLTEEV